ncbi:virulence factor MviN [Candidatus Blochmanniella floridana]|uniref:Probable lipid II flippase MurJ n=1 Tax=Blochmanniella floridana TaxID=203907 RepID=Q7VQX6_BLOFL|nr:virulence factor MviN [Candidatus Blochmannia floridanus]
MNLLKSLFRMSSITMCSRILGFVRDTIIARVFGVSTITDSFFIAFKLSNFLRRIFAEGACYQIFLPILSEYKCFANNDEIRIFISRTFGLLIMVLIIVIFIGLLVAPWIITFTVPGFNNFSEKFSLTILLFRIMLPYTLFISMASLMGAILNTWNFFLVPAFIPIFLNISMIGFMLFLSYFNLYSPIMGLSWSVFIGGLVQCMYCLPFLKKIRLLVLPSISFKDNRVRRMCRSMGLMLIAIFSNQMSLTINTIFASFLPDGSISWMYYADRIIELPIGIFGVTITTILLPCLSKFIARGNDTEYINLINWGIKLCCIFSLPSAFILGLLSKPLIITLFQYGKFSEWDVLMTQYSVIAYSVGLPGLILVKILTAGFYSRYDIKTPIQIIIITVIFTQFMNLICIHTLRHVTFACSISLGAWLNVGLLFWKLKKKYAFQLATQWLFFFCQLMMSIVVMCVVLYFTESVVCVGDCLQNNVFIIRLLKIISIFIISIGSYFVMLWLLGLRLKDFNFLSKDSN